MQHAVIRTSTKHAMAKSADYNWPFQKHSRETWLSIFCWNSKQSKQAIFLQVQSDTACHSVHGYIISTNTERVCLVNVLIYFNHAPYFLTKFPELVAHYTRMNNIWNFITLRGRLRCCDQKFVILVASKQLNWMNDEILPWVGWEFLYSLEHCSFWLTG